jgi:hypothetical protein
MFAENPVCQPGEEATYHDDQYTGSTAAKAMVADRRRLRTSFRKADLQHGHFPQTPL